MQPLFSLVPMVESPKVELADSQIRENYGHALRRQEQRRVSRRRRPSWARNRFTAHDTKLLAETSATSPVDENSKVLGTKPAGPRWRASRLQIPLNVYGSLTVSSALDRSGNTAHVTGMAPFIPLNPVGRRRPGGRALVRPCRFDKSQNCLRALVPEEGVEPSRPEGHGILSPARLPVSPLRPRKNVQYNVSAQHGATGGLPRSLAALEVDRADVALGTLHLHSIVAQAVPRREVPRSLRAGCVISTARTESPCKAEDLTGCQPGNFIRVFGLQARRLGGTSIAPIAPSTPFD